MSRSTTIKKVLVVQELLPHYRVPFFQQARHILGAAGVQLDVAHARRAGGDDGRGDEARLDDAIELNGWHIPICGRRATWLPVVRLARRYDLMITGHESRMLSNYAVLAQRHLGVGPRIAFFGHGGNLQNRSDLLYRLAESSKRRYTSAGDWFFAYTGQSARRFEMLGAPSERISVINNAIDVHELRTQYLHARYSTSITSSDDVFTCLYIGSLYPEKDISFLIRAGDLISAQEARFRLVIVGGGTDLDLVQKATLHRPWLSAVGPVKGQRKADLAAAAYLMLIPKLVGLVVLDSFALELPLITLENAGHGPEIEYLDPGVNGIVVPSATEEGYARSVLSVLTDPDEISRLKSGCATASSRYDVTSMAENFARGVMSAIAT